MATGLTHVALGYEIVNDTSLPTGFETTYLGVRTSPLTIQVCRQDMTHVALGIRNSPPTIQTCRYDLTRVALWFELVR